MSKQHKRKSSKSVLKLATVGYLWRRSTAQIKRMQADKKVPYIRLSGLWLRKYGFEIGGVFEIKAKARRLILIIKASDDDLKNKKKGTV